MEASDTNTVAACVARLAAALQQDEEAGWMYPSLLPLGAGKLNASLALLHLCRTVDAPIP